MLSQALRFWDAIKGKVKQSIQAETQNVLRCERYDVTTAPDGTKMGVRQPFGEKEIFIPYTQEVANAKTGDTVMVVWHHSMSTAKAWFYGNGPT